MTFERVASEGHAYCVWFDKNILKNGVFSLVTLNKFEGGFGL